jgi:hypothetical protein
VDVNQTTHRHSCAGVPARDHPNSPGGVAESINTPVLAHDELTGPRAAGYRRMTHISAAGRAGTPNEGAHLAALILGADGGFHHRQRPTDGKRLTGPATLRPRAN